MLRGKTKEVMLKYFLNDRRNYFVCRNDIITCKNYVLSAIINVLKNQ